MNTFKKNAEKFKIAAQGIFVFPLSPRRQFRRLIVVALFIFAVLVVLHMRFFTQIESQDFFQASTASVAPTETVNEKKLTNVLSRFGDKAAFRDGALKLTPFVAEPSR